MSKFTNPNYLKFIKEGAINPINEDQLKLVLDGIDHKYKQEARALVILLYYTGARPCEVLNLKSLDIRRENIYLLINCPASKRGLARPIYLKIANPLIQEVYKYALQFMPERFLFFNFRSTRHRTRINKKGQIKETVCYSDNLEKHFKKWFSVLDINSYPPYFLRHNRFSKLAQRGATLEDLRQLKGSKTYASVLPYLHLSTDKAKKLSKIND